MFGRQDTGGLLMTENRFPLKQETIVVFFFYILYIIIISFCAYLLDKFVRENRTCKHEWTM